jgi:hypothetical protein
VPGFVVNLFWVVCDVEGRVEERVSLACLADVHPGELRIVGT